MLFEGIYYMVGCVYGTLLVLLQTLPQGPFTPRQTWCMNHFAILDKAHFIIYRLYMSYQNEFTTYPFRLREIGTDDVPIHVPIIHSIKANYYIGEVWN